MPWGHLIIKNNNPNSAIAVHKRFPHVHSN